MNRKVRANFLLLTTSFIWGSAFVAQRVGMENLEPFTFNGVRMLVACFALSIVALILERAKIKSADIPDTEKATPQNLAPENQPSKAHSSEIQLSTDQSSKIQHPKNHAKAKKMLYISGLFCGMILFIASSFQQVGLVYTTAGKAGFITTLYIIIVPVLGLFLKKKVGKRVWFCVFLALVGLYFLSFIENMQLNIGDILVLFCAIGYAIHIIVIDHYSPYVDSVKLSQIQFFIAGMLSLVVMFVFESPNIIHILGAWRPILYVGVISGAVGFTFQIIAQKDTQPAIAALLMSFEAVFAALTGFIILNEILTIRELFGCALMFVAVVVAQFPEKQKARL